MADRNVFVFGMPGEELLLDMVGWLLLLLLASKLLVVLDVLWLSLLLLLLLAGLEEELDLDLRCGCKKCPTMLEWKKQTKLAGWLLKTKPSFLLLGLEDGMESGCFGLL